MKKSTKYKCLTSKEVELLLEQPKNIDLKGIRDKAMLEFAYATGMRVTEIISLNLEDVNLEEGFVCLPIFYFHVEESWLF